MAMLIFVFKGKLYILSWAFANDFLSCNCVTPLRPQSIAVGFYIF